MTDKERVTKLLEFCKRPTTSFLWKAEAYRLISKIQEQNRNYELKQNFDEICDDFLKNYESVNFEFNEEEDLY